LELHNNKHITQRELSIIIGINEKNIRNNITKLKTKGLIERVGTDKAGYWNIRTEDLSTKENARNEIVDSRDTNRDTIRDTIKDTNGDTNELTEIQSKILIEIEKNKNITMLELSKTININLRNIKNNMSKLKEMELLERVGNNKVGYWRLK
jgi:predicted HTH transcriptional regulator